MTGKAHKFNEFRCHTLSSEPYRIGCVLIYSIHKFVVANLIVQRLPDSTKLFFVLCYIFTILKLFHINIDFSAVCSIRWRGVNRYMSWLLYSRGKSSHHLLDRRLGGPWCQFGCSREEKIPCMDWNPILLVTHSVA